jgi:DNA modification methylase
MFSFIGETVLDPFLGSGTTSIAAIRTNRNSIGYEINDKFQPIIEERVKKELSLLNSFNYRFENQNIDKTDWILEKSRLPYKFFDPVMIKKRIDPSNLKFGSKIDTGDIKNGTLREEYFTVREIIDVNLIKINNNQKIRLIGIDKKNDKINEALNFLKEKLVNQQVYFRYDEKKFDNDDNLMTYVYLKNKTFINCHLIKKGLASTDKNSDYRFKQKFIEIESRMGKIEY